MKNTFTLLTLFIAIIVVIAISCAKESKALVAIDYSLSEEFDTVSNAIAKGWVIANNTKPIGTMGWVQGYFYVSLYHGLALDKLGLGYPNSYAYGGGFSGNNPAASGTDFIMTTSDCGYGVANCSNWLISPELTVKTGDVVNFYTRTYGNPALAADRLELRMNEVNSTADVGRDSNSIGGFTRVLVDINAKFLLSGAGSYPAEWTKFVVKISDVPVAKKTRIGFRYYVPDGGPQGPNGLGIGIDKFIFSSN